MSEESLDVVREIYRAFAERRFPDERLAEDFEWETNPALPDADIYRGREAVKAYFRDWVAGWEEVSNDVERLIDRGDEVVVLIHGRFRLAPDSIPLEADYAHIWTLREGVAIRARATAGRTREELGFQL